MLYKWLADPPGPPEIEGYDGQPVRLGDTVTLSCVSHGGNPLAETAWFKNDEPIDFSYTTSGRESLNAYNLVASTEDNGAVYTCQAKNHLSPRPMTASVRMTVLCKATVNLLLMPDIKRRDHADF